MSWFTNPAFKDKDNRYSHSLATKYCKRLGVEMFSMNQRQSSLHHVFNVLNRRRVDMRPLQKKDIVEECKSLPNIDLALIVIESIDSHWLSIQADKIREKNGT